VVTGAGAIRVGRPADAPFCAAILNAWIDATPWMPRAHAPADIVRYHHDIVFRDQDVLVAEEAGTVTGYLALAGTMVSALYVARPGCGLGHALLAAAKRARPGGLTLWTFADNLGARRFYAREGFWELRRTAGENEEGLPDILFGWDPRARSPAARPERA